jgi:hypothetical protein
MNMIPNATHPIALALGITRDGSKISVERRSQRSIKNWLAVFRAEDHMDKQKRKRLRHSENYRSVIQPPQSAQGVLLYQPGTTPQGFTRISPRAEGPTYSLAMAATLILCLLPSLSQAQSPPPPKPHQLTIRIINAKTNQPITDEHLNVALRADQIGSVQMSTDKKTGIILVNYGDATTIRILSNMYADCRPRAELYTDYAIADVLSTGITTGNLCSTAKPAPKPGILTLYEIPKTFIRNYPASPNTSLPHSDENPHQDPNQ